MDRLYSWSARRAGGRITVTHSCGKVPNIVVIEPVGGVIIATRADGTKFELANPAPIGG